MMCIENAIVQPLFVLLFAATPCLGGPPPPGGIDLDSPPNPVTTSAQSAGPCVHPCYYFTSFEADDGFTAGAWIGDGNQGAIGGIFETWDAACSRFFGSTTEGHVETANPFSGAQHLRLSKDPAVGSLFTGCIIDARVPSNPVAEANTPPIGPTTISVEIAISDVSGANFNVQPQARWMGLPDGSSPVLLLSRRDLHHRGF